MTPLSVSASELIFVQHDLTITVSDSDTRRCTLRVVGEVDSATSPLLRAMLEQQLECGRTYVRLDMSGVAFIDTAGVNVLLDMHPKYLAARGTLVILAATATIAGLPADRTGAELCVAGGRLVGRAAGRRRSLS
jgi:anti-anti-sigma factor